MKFKVEKISGAVDDKFTCGVFSKHVTIEGISGVFACCVLVEGGEAVGVENLGGFLHDEFENDVKKLSEEPGNVLSRLVATRDGQANRFSGMGISASFAWTLVLKGAIYTAVFGDRVKINVFRPPKSYEVKFAEGSGKLLPGDLVLVSTDKFIENFDAGVFAKDDEIIFEDIIDGLATDISAIQEQSEIGAIFVKTLLDGAASKVKDEAGVEKVKAGEVSEEGKEPEAMVETETAPRQAKPPFVSRIISNSISEIKKLRVGDIGAIFRLRRNIVFLAIVIILVLVGSGLFTIQGNMNREKNREFAAHMQKAGDKYSEAVGIFDLNRDKARELLIEADSEVKLALALFPESEEAKDLSAQIAEKFGAATSLETVSFKTFWDGKGEVAGISKGNGNFYVFGEAGVIELDEGGKEVDKFSDENVGGGFAWDNSVFTISAGSVVKLSEENSEVAKGENVRDMAVFLGNIYILGSEQIMKFVPIEGGYAQSVDYLENNRSFGDSSRFTIDGSVWVTSGQEIIKYTRGVDDNFKIEGLSGVGELGEIYTNSDLDKIYAIDRSNSALIVLSKEGVWEKTYNSGEFAKATDLYIDEEGGKLYICSGERVLVADL